MKNKQDSFHIVVTNLVLQKNIGNRIQQDWRILIEDKFKQLKKTTKLNSLSNTDLKF